MAGPGGCLSGRCVHDLRMHAQAGMGSVLQRTGEGQSAARGMLQMLRFCIFVGVNSRFCNMRLGLLRGCGNGRSSVGKVQSRGELGQPARGVDGSDGGIIGQRCDSMSMHAGVRHFFG